MSKSNVNPGLYKLAGRERQGEDIAQERHKQKHAESLARERTQGAPEFWKAEPALSAGSAAAAPQLRSRKRAGAPASKRATAPKRTAKRAAPRPPAKKRTGAKPATKTARVRGGKKRATRSAARRRNR